MSELWRRVDIPTPEDWEWEDAPDSVMVNEMDGSAFMLVKVEPVDEFEVTTYKSMGMTIETAGLPFYVNMDQEVGIDDVPPGKYAIVKLEATDE